MHLIFYSNRGEKFLPGCQKGKCLNIMAIKPYGFVQTCHVIFCQSTNLALYLMFVQCLGSSKSQKCLSKIRVFYQTSNPNLTKKAFPIRKAKLFTTALLKQECIPVGCVPPHLRIVPGCWGGEVVVGQ